MRLIVDARRPPRARCVVDAGRQARISVRASHANDACAGGGAVRRVCWPRSLTVGAQAPVGAVGVDARAGHAVGGRRSGRVEFALVDVDLAPAALVAGARAVALGAARRVRAPAAVRARSRRAPVDRGLAPLAREAGGALAAHLARRRHRAVAVRAAGRAAARVARLHALVRRRRQLPAGGVGRARRRQARAPRRARVA